jgi:hypothetical protein
MQQAVLLVFNEGVDPERIKKWVENLEKSEVLETKRIQDFEADHEYPVLYFP